MKQVFKILKSRIFIMGLLLVLQLAILVSTLVWFSESFYMIYIFLIILSFIVGLHVLNRDDNPSYKILWIVLIFAIPLIGGVMYLIFGGQKVPKELRTQTQESVKNAENYYWQNQEVLERLKATDVTAYKQSNYLWNVGHYASYEHTQTKFLPLGEDMYEVMIEEIRKAEHYIFLEFFIISEGIMWNTILDLLVEKVKSGVDVRVMYDDAGCYTTLPADYISKLQRYGIKAKVFNPIRAMLLVRMNNRDHRKIFVVDGKVAITGGNNLADEYINKKERFGHWKDSSVVIRGEAVWSFTLMFLQFWNYGETEKDDFFEFKADQSYSLEMENDGIVQPFSDSPTDDDNIGESVHLNMINNANEYLYATTPYLILDHETKIALKLAAKNGTDVRIIVPHIPDKWYAFLVTQSNYHSLMQAGVKIYEYTPGFIHSKSMVVDDSMCFVGSVNMDYRSYYLHYECGVWFYKSKVVMECKEDFLKTLEVSKEMTLDEVEKWPWYKKLIQAVFNLFGPLM